MSPPIATRKEDQEDEVTVDTTDVYHKPTMAMFLFLSSST